MLIAGPKGSGKSSLCGLLRPDVWISTEQEPVHVRDLLHHIGIDADGMPSIATVHYRDQWTGILSGVESKMLVLDSITEFGLVDGPPIMREFMEQVQRSSGRGIVVAQYTKRENIRGSEELPHLADIVANVDVDVSGLRRVNVSKNRAGGLFSCYFELGNEGVTKPVFHQAYSVEGSPGSYQLLPFPSSEAKWQDLFKEYVGPIERTASALRKAGKYKSGWLKPEDYDYRRQFAIEHGLTWIAPEGF